MTVRRGVPAALLVAAALLVTASACASDSCACQYPVKDESPSPSSGRQSG